jgi:hypothetical protein
MTTDHLHQPIPPRGGRVQRGGILAQTQKFESPHNFCIAYVLQVHQLTWSRGARNALQMYYRKNIDK